MKYFYHMVYRKGLAGLSNLIMSVELGVILAHLTDRVLVLGENNTPAANLVPYGAPVSDAEPSRITDLLDLPVMWIDGKNFDLGAYDSLELRDGAAWDSVFYYPPSLRTDTADFKAFCGVRRDILTYGPEIEQAPVLKYSGGAQFETLSCYSYYFYLDDPAKRSVYALLRNLKPKAPLAALAEKIAKDLAPFNAVHIRRGDFKLTIGVTTRDRTADHVIEALKPHFDPNDRLVILTDERDDPIFDGITAAYPNHIFLDHFILENYRSEFLGLASHDAIALAYLSQLVAAESEDFVGTMTSTFSSLIQRYRGNRGKPEPFKFLWNEIPDADAELEPGRHAFSECMPLENGVMVEENDGPYSWNRLAPRLNPGWMRGWPESFLGQEGGSESADQAKARAANGGGQSFQNPLDQPEPESGEAAVSELIIAFDGHDVVFRCDDAELTREVAELFGPMLADASTNRIGGLSVRTRNGSRRLFVNDRPAEAPLFGANPLRAISREVACQFIDARPDLIWLHAGVAARGDECVVIPGSWGSGKSTLVTKLCAMGWTYLSDDIAPIDPRSLKVMPFPQTPQIREAPPREFSRDQLSGLPKTTVALGDEKFCREPKNLRKIVLPRFDRHSATKLAAHPPAQAVTELLENCLSAARGKDSAIASICEIVEQSPGFSLAYQNVEMAAQLVDETFDQPIAHPPQRDLGGEQAENNGETAAQTRVAEPADEALDRPAGISDLIESDGESEMNGSDLGTVVRDIEVSIALTGGSVHKTVLPSDSPILHDLYAALGRLGNSAEPQPNILFQVPLNEGRSAFTFSSSQLVYVTTEPPALIEPRPAIASHANAPQTEVHAEPPKFVRIDGFLTPAENRELLDYAVENRDQFEASTVMPPVDDMRSSKVLNAVGESKWPAIFANRLKVHLPHLMRTLNIDKFPIGHFEVQLTASNDGDFFKVHLDDGASNTTRKITFVYYVNLEPKQFHGGQLLIYAGPQPDPSGQYGDPVEIVEPANNMMVVFSSDIHHEVAIVRCPSEDFAGGRFTINGWVHGQGEQPVSADQN